jgi:dihydroneopterin aldolase
MDRIVLTGMRFEGRLGVSEEEREFPQFLELDIEIEAPLDAPAASDDLGDAIDYAPLVERARTIVEGSSYRLLEALAGAVATDVLSAAPAAVAVTVRLRKLAVPLDVDMDHAAVELRRERS